METEEQDSEGCDEDEQVDFGLLPGIPSSAGDKSFVLRRGTKDFEPNGTDLQSDTLARSRQILHEALGGERMHTSKLHSQAVWIAGRQLAKVTVAKGQLFKGMGKADSSGSLWLLPEELLYMVERGSVECWWESGLQMSLQAAYAMCLPALGNAQAYLVYSYLRRVGFILLRAQTTERRALETAAGCSLLRYILDYVTKTVTGSLNVWNRGRVFSQGMANGNGGNI